MILQDTIDNKICQAIQILIDKALAAANFNRTVKATIIRPTSKDCQYQVKYQDSKMYAYSIDKDIKYKKGDTVYVLFLNNDTKNNKIILTKAR